MKVQRSKLVAVFVALGAKNATGWDDKDLIKKAGKLPKLMNDDVTIDDKELAKLAKAVTAAVGKGETIELENDDKADKAGGKDKAASGKAKEKPAEVEAEEEGDEEEEEADEDDEEEKPKAAKNGDGKGGKGKTPAEGRMKKAGDGGPGVIESIVQYLAKASEKKPISKKDILDKLAARFPDRDKESMGKTVNVQVPNRIKNDKKLEVHKNAGGYWIDIIPAGHPCEHLVK